MSEFKQYRRKEIAELRRYIPGERWDDKISISAADKENGSPKVGDMIARNPKNWSDMWLVAEQYFKDNFEAVDSGFSTYSGDCCSLCGRSNCRGYCFK
jgi:hypothetical protein